MDRHPNLDILESLYFGDRALFFEKLHPEYVCHTPGTSQIAGRFIGADGMREHGAQMRALTDDGAFKAKPRGPILIDDIHAMVPTEINATRNGRTLRMKAFGLYRFEGDKIMEHWEVPLDMEAFDAFWGQAPGPTP